MEALVTGGAQGIGYQIVESLINDGFSVTVFDINPETLSKAKTSFGAKCSKLMSQSIRRQTSTITTAHFRCISQQRWDMET